MKRPEASRQREWTADRLYAYGLRFLTYRARSERELRQRFQHRAAPPDLADAVIERLRANGLIDDEAFARAWVASRRSASPRGSRLLRTGLAAKGVARDTITASLATTTDEATLALAAATKKARALQNEPDPAFVRKLTDFLLRRGFEYDTATTAVRELLAQRGSSAADFEP